MGLNHHNTRFSILSCIASLALIAPACTTYQDDGRLVRHHIGYTRIITPQAYSTGEEIRVLEVTNFGLWIKTDKRPGALSEGNGFGVGAIYTRRESVPLACSLVIRLSTDQDIYRTIELINEAFGGMNPCIIQDSNLPLSSLAAVLR